MLQTGEWIEVRDGDPRAVGLFKRHYSCTNQSADHVRYGFSGNGESMIMLTEDCRALWCWRQVIGEGIVCSVFRNESPERLSSELVKEADEIAWLRWPGVGRHFTHVDARKIKSSNPGYCFKKAGWRECGRTKRHNLVILERRREDATD